MIELLWNQFTDLTGKRGGSDEDGFSIQFCVPTALPIHFQSLFIFIFFFIVKTKKEKVKNKRIFTDGKFQNDGNKKRRVIEEET